MHTQRLVKVPGAGLAHGLWLRQKNKGKQKCSPNTHISKNDLPVFSAKRTGATKDEFKNLIHPSRQVNSV